MRVISRPISAWMPSSSSSSRRNAWGGVSPASILPPGNSHLSARAWCSVRWQHRISSPRTIKAATTCLVKIDPSFLRARLWRQRSCGCLQVSPNQAGTVLDELAVVGGKRRGLMAVDIEFSDDLAFYKNRSDDFGLGFERTGEIAGIAIHIVDDHGLGGGNGGAADPLMQWNARVRSCRSHVGSENEHGLGTVCAFFEHVEADPVVMLEQFLQALDDHRHQVLSVFGGVREIGQLISQGLIVRGHDAHLITGHRVAGFPVAWGNDWDGCPSLVGIVAITGCGTLQGRMYSPQLLDHFEHPRNAGGLTDANARVRVENPACGDILELDRKSQ